MLPNVFTWLPIPRLPKVPQHFIDRAYEICRDAEAMTFTDENKMWDLGIVRPSEYHRTLIKNGVEMPTRIQRTYFMGEEWEQWVRENIFPTFVETSVRPNLPGPGSHVETTQHGPHCDNPGKCRLYYLVDRGGEDAETVFYYKPGTNILVYDVDKHYEENNGAPITENNIDLLEEVDRVRFPLNEWVLLNGYILHGIDNVTGMRINFNVSIRPEDFTFDIRPTK